MPLDSQEAEKVIYEAVPQRAQEEEVTEGVIQEVS